MAADVSPSSSAGDPLLGQWDSVKMVRAFRAPSTMTFGIAVVWLYGRNRMLVLFTLAGQSAPSYESEELALIPFVYFGKRLMLARVQNRAVLEEVFGKHQCRGLVARSSRRTRLLFPARG